MNLFLTASNIDFSEILETRSYFVVQPWCIKPLKIVLDLVHLKKDCTYASVYDQLFMEIRNIPWLNSCLYRRITGWESCGIRYFHEIA